MPKFKEGSIRHLEKYSNKNMVYKTLKIFFLIFYDESLVGFQK